MASNLTGLSIGSGIARGLQSAIGSINAGLDRRDDRALRDRDFALRLKGLQAQYNKGLADASRQTYLDYEKANQDDLAARMKDLTLKETIRHNQAMEGVAGKRAAADSLKAGREATDTAVGAKVSALTKVIEGIRTQGSEQGKRWYLPWFMEKDEYTPDQLQTLEGAQSRLKGMLGIQPPSSGASTFDWRGVK